MARGRTKKATEETQEAPDTVEEQHVSANEEPVSDQDEPVHETTLIGKELESQRLKEFDEEINTQRENGMVLSKPEIQRRKAHIRLECGVLSLEDQLKTLNTAHAEMMKSVNDYHRTARTALESAVSSMRHALKQSDKKLPEFHKKTERGPSPEYPTSKHLRALIDRETVSSSEAQKLLSIYINGVKERLVKKGVEKPSHEQCRLEDKKLHKFIPDDELKEYITALHAKKCADAREKGKPEPEMPSCEFTLTHIMHFIHSNLIRNKD